MSTYALIPAAGMGRRMGCQGNKQYLQLLGRPILAHTLQRFEDSPQIDGIWLVSPQDEITYCQHQIVERYCLTKVRAVIAGGAQRQDSVRLGLQAMAAKKDDLVLIHDGVRPLFDTDLIPELIAAAFPDGAVVGVPVKDTIKTVEHGVISGTPERDRLWQVQTPQVFPYGRILAAHQKSLADGFTGTDDASLLERLGGSVRMVQGDYANLKITTPEDLLLAQALLKG